MNFRGEDNVCGANNKGEFIIKTPRVLELAKQYYGCDDIDGIPLENDGGSGSKGAHWERSLLGDEFMTASEIYEPKVTAFTMALYFASISVII